MSTSTSGTSEQGAQPGTAGLRLTIAVSCGAGLAALLLLLLKASPGALVSAGVSILLFPGFLLAAVLWNSEGTRPLLAVLALNASLYSAIALAIVNTSCRGARSASLRRAAIWLSVPAAVAVGLACIPALNPLAPQGMADLEKEEAELRELFPLGMAPDQARAAWQSRGIQVYETTETSETSFKRGNVNLATVRGDRLASARVMTNAAQFPCGYEIELILIFGQDAKLTQRHIERRRLCP
jgi:hypothetical protein